MPTRTQFLRNLQPLPSIPEDMEPECAICSEDLSDPVEVCPKHVFCRDCVMKWLTRRRRNTCPTCRRELFAMDDGERLAVGGERMAIVAQALERSRLLTNEFDHYGHSGWTMSEVHRATAAANRYLAEEQHEDVAGGAAVIDMRVLGPHIMAMANLLREYARATHRGYSGYQRRDWKITVDCLRSTLAEMDGYTLQGNDLTNMAQDFRRVTMHNLQGQGVDVYSGRFFMDDGLVESPAGDLEFLLGYVVFQSVKNFERQQMHRRAQAEALRGEASRSRWALRWFRQTIFGGL